MPAQPLQQPAQQAAAAPVGNEGVVGYEGNEGGGWFDIGRGVRQGCAIAPLLFNVFFDCVVRLSLAEMPEGCGVRLSFRAEGEVLPWHAGGPSTMLTIAALMYWNDYLTR
jgi:hypothetical protein